MAKMRINPRQKTTYRRYYIAASLLLLFLSGGFIIFFQFGFNKDALAAVNTTTATGGTNISADKAANATSPQWTTLGNIIITEASQGDFATGTNMTLALNAPTGWEFNTSASVTTNVTSGGNVSVGSVTISSSAVTLTYSVGNTNKSDVLTIIGVQVRATNGACLPCSGNITPTVTPTGKISGLTNGSTNLGSLSQVIGALNKLVVTLPGQTFTSGSGNSGSVTTQTAGTSFNITKIYATDQFNTVITSYTGTKTISYSGPGSALTSPTYTTSVSFTSGQSTTTLATNLKKAETVSITASDGTYSGTSSSLVVNPGTLTNFIVEASSGGNIGTQIAGTSFNTRITARDANNNTVTGFNGAGNTVDITSTATLTAGSGTTATFTNGVLTHAVTIYPASASATITATKTGGAIAATSNSFAINNPSPTLTSISHICKFTTDADFTLTVNGTGFNNMSVIRINGVDLATTYVSSTQLTATITSTELSTAGTKSITVFNSSPGGGTSASASLYSYTGANAGVAQAVCGNSTTLAANSPVAGTGAWSVNTGTGTTFSSSSSPTSTFTGMAGYNYSLRWTISYNGCSNYSDVNITLDSTSIGGSITSDETVCSGSNGNIIFLSTYNGSILKWQSSTDGGSTYSDIFNTSASYTYTNITQSVLYRAIVKSGVCPADTSSDATITVNEATVGGTATASTSTACSGSNSGTITLSGYTGNILRWQSSTDGGSTYTNISNTTAEQSFSNLTTTTLYRAVVQSGVCNYAYSSTATITVDQTIYITAQPASVSAFTGSNVTFTVSSTGSGLSYQWQDNSTGSFSNISGATSSSLTLSNVSTSMSGLQYQCNITASCGTMTSNAATLTVTGVATGDYRSITNGNWSSTATWERYNGSAWVAATSTPTSSASQIRIQNGTTVTMNSSVTADEILIESGGQLTVNTGTFTINNGAGTDMMVYGTLDIVSTVSFASTGTLMNIPGTVILESTGTTTMATGSKIDIASGGLFKRKGGTMPTSSGYFLIKNGGTFEHAMNGGTLPTLTWTSGSTLNISGMTTSLPSNANQSFANVTWNSAGQTGNLDLNGLFMTIGGDFNIMNTGSGSLYEAMQGNTTASTVAGNLNMSGGTYYLCQNGSATMIVSGNFNVTGGLFAFNQAGATAYGNTSGIVTVYGDINSTGGTIDMSQYTGNNTSKGTGIFNLYGNLNVSSTGLITETENSHGEIWFTNSGGVVQYYDINNRITNQINYIVNSNAIVDCRTKLLTGDGTFTLMSAGGLIIGSPDGIRQTAMSGNVQVTGTRSYSTGADYTYNASSAQVSGDGLPWKERNLTLNNANNCTLTNSTTTSGTQTFTAGIWIATNDTLTLGTSTSNPGVLSRTSGHVYGYYQRWVAATTASNILFPVGTLNYYNGANFSFTTAPTTGGSIVSTFIPTNPGTAGLPITDAGETCNNIGYAYWSFGAMNSFAGGAWTVNLYANGFPGVSDYTKLHIFRRTGTGASWTNPGTHLVGSGSNSAPVANRSSLNVLGHYGIVSGVNILPIKLLSFAAKLDKTGDQPVVNLLWKTGSETNNDFFTIERSSNGFDFEIVSKVKGAGNTTTVRNYTSIDENPMAGYSYYRLKQTDFDGKYSYSKIQGVDNGNTAVNGLTISELYPIPFRDRLIMNYQTGESETVVFNLMGTDGKVYFYQTLQANTGTNSLVFEAPETLPAGTYILSLSSNSGKVTKTVIRK